MMMIFKKENNDYDINAHVDDVIIMIWLNDGTNDFSFLLLLWLLLFWFNSFAIEIY